MQSGILKLKSLFKTNFGSSAAPNKRVSFEIPDDIKQLYQDDPEEESYVLVEIEKQKKEHKEHLAKVAAERKSRALNITVQWLQKLEAEEKKRQKEEAECVQCEKEEQERKKREEDQKKLAEEEKHKKKEDEIREKVLALKKQKKEEDARKEAECKSKLEDFELENKIRVEQNMELLPIPLELLDRNVPEILKKPQEIKKEKILNNSVKSPEQNSGSNSVSSTPNSSVATVAESVKRCILPEGETPPKKQKKESSSINNPKEFAALLLLSLSKCKTRSSKQQPPQIDSQEEYKMFCKQKQKMMSQADGFLMVKWNVTLY